jgi:hypothetical protein
MSRRYQARARQRVGGSFGLARNQSVAVFAKPLPSLGIRIFERVETPVAKNDDRLIPVELKKLVKLALLTCFLAPGAPEIHACELANRRVTGQWLSCPSTVEWPTMAAGGT